MAEPPIRGMVVPVGARPQPVTLPADTLKTWVADRIGTRAQAHQVSLSEGSTVTVYAAHNGAYAPANRAIWTTDGPHAGTLDQILNGDLIIVGHDKDGQARSLTPAETTQAGFYFTHVADPGSGGREQAALDLGITGRTNPFAQAMHHPALAARTRQQERDHTAEQASQPPSLDAKASQVRQTPTRTRSGSHGRDATR